MDEAIRAELDKLTKIIINAMPVERIYLFGSYAYGITLERIVNRDGVRIYG